MEKGSTSGSTQDLIRVEADCDRDTLRFTVRQHGPGFCHLDRRNCWAEDRGLHRLDRRLRHQIADAPTGSFTARLASDPDLLASKLREEADELAEASSRDAIIWEAADLFYFTLSRLAAAEVDLSEVEAELDRRELVTKRRDGSANFSRGVIR